VTDTCGKQCGESDTIQSGKCKESERGTFLIDDLQRFQSPYLNFVQDFKPEDLNKQDNSTTFKKVYNAPTKGYYCIYIQPAKAPAGGSVLFLAKMTVDNPYGKLPASEYPKLPFYGLLSIVYLSIGALWMLRSWWFWKDLLMLQHFISGVIFFLMVEMAFNYGFFDYINAYGTVHTGLLVMVVVLNSGRNSISFFMLLIVSLGYGVVRPTLGSTMKKCVILMVVHFVCGVLYSTGAIVVNEVTSAILALVFAFPLSAAMTAFYYFTLNVSVPQQQQKKRIPPLGCLFF
jgi:hypothetical protein